MHIDYLKSELVELFNCEINETEITAKLVFFDKFIGSRIVTLTTPKGIKYRIRVPEGLVNRPTPYFNVHQGVFSIKLV